MLTTVDSYERMKVLHVMPYWAPAWRYGGPIYTALQLCQQLADDGCELRVLTTNTNGPNAVLDVDTRSEVELAGGLRVRYCRRMMGEAVSPMLLRRLPEYVRWADVVHLTAVYSFPTIPTLLACKVLRKPVVWSPHGALQRWPGTTRPRAKTMWEWICRAAAPEGLLLHVTSEEEAKESQGRFPDIETVLIPNGVDVPGTTAHIEGNGALRLLYLGRLHPIKAIENLLAACKLLNGSSYTLTIAGSGDAHYETSIRRKIQELALSDRVEMVGEVLGEAKRKLFENADVAVVPSHTENFGMVVAEALAHAVPVIASKGTPWKRIEEIACGLWVDNDPGSLACAVERIGTMPLADMGRRGRNWMAEEFSWSRRARETRDCYSSLLFNRGTEVS